MIAIITHTPDDYSGVTREKMIQAGLLRIELEFIHNEDYSKGQQGKTRYVFKDKIVHSAEQYRKIVFNYH